ncbi:pentatricopeptide repeat-containing protein [Panicum miliaceum]|uniref:Pentatricopeptide repeat-containing protein n=1 Tax=Panicum miliaceum TaxID=4540 RepID=A0A3L6Q4K0_PANMI|nr:pentatricopeptide repeat-containing protein [Panicum miliaceum]
MRPRQRTASRTSPQARSWWSRRIQISSRGGNNCILEDKGRSRSKQVISAFADDERCGGEEPDGKEEVNPRAEAFLEIIGRVPPGEMEAVLSACGIGPTAEVAEQVLKSCACYSRPKSAVRFFRWAARSVAHTAYAWNLLVDILGKAAMFEPMWDAIRSMN